MLVTNHCYRICEDENAHQYNSTVDVKKMCHSNVMKNAHQKNGSLMINVRHLMPQFAMKKRANNGHNECNAMRKRPK